jgi:hypothetical protein
MTSNHECDLHATQNSLVIVTAYDKAQEKLFKRIKRKKWSKGSYVLRGEWSQSMYHQGNIRFRVRVTEDRRYWALYSESFGRKIEAVVIANRPTSVDEVTAEAMQAVEDADGPYIDVMVDYEDFDPETFCPFRTAARERSRLRRAEEKAALEAKYRQAAEQSPAPHPSPRAQYPHPAQAPQHPEPPGSPQRAPKPQEAPNAQQGENEKPLPNAQPPEKP